MAFCQKCGFEMSGAALFCSKCGTKTLTTHPTPDAPAISATDCPHQNLITEATGGNLCADCNHYISRDTGEAFLDDRSSADTQLASAGGAEETPRKGLTSGVKGLIGAIVAVIVVAFVVTTGLLSPAVGTSLNDQLAKQYAPLAGPDIVVVCPPSAKFHAGATIVCEVSGVSSTSFMPNLGYIDVAVGKDNQFHALPVTH